MTKTARDPIDWASIEHEYRYGKLSIRALAAWFSVSDRAIRKRAEKYGWVRVGPQGAPPPPSPSLPAIQCEAPPPLTEEAIDPKKIVGRGRNLVLRMLDELDGITSNVGEIEDLILEETKDDRDGQRRTAMLRAVSLPGRAATLKALATAFKTLGESSTAAAPKGKKEERQAEAERLTSKFAPSPPPKHAVN